MGRGAGGNVEKGIQNAKCRMQTAECKVVSEETDLTPRHNDTIRVPSSDFKHNGTTNTTENAKSEVRTLESKLELRNP
jgi:hypothetical protein